MIVTASVQRVGLEMALVQGVRSRSKRCALGQQISFFHSSVCMREKWRSKYKNRTGGYTDSSETNNSHKGSFSRSSSSSQNDQRRWNNRKSFSSKKTNDWEAYLKYEGDWERFCRKFTNLSDFESRPRSQKGKAKKMWHEWESEGDEEEDEEEEDDDGWDDDPTFGTRYRKTKVQRPPHHSGAAASQPRAVITIGQRSDRLALGLPPAGSLTMDELKAAFRAAALKWHPDRHQGSSKDSAEEKFKTCGNAYRALCIALASSSSSSSSNNRC